MLSFTKVGRGCQGGYVWADHFVLVVKLVMIVNVLAKIKKDG